MASYLGSDLQDDYNLCTCAELVRTLNFLMTRMSTQLWRHTLVQDDYKYVRRTQ
jgi:hypothetical protein